MAKKKEEEMILKKPSFMANAPPPEDKPKPPPLTSNLNRPISPLPNFDNPIKKQQPAALSGMDSKMNDLDNLINKAAAKQAVGGFLPKAPTSLTETQAKKPTAQIIQDQDDEIKVDDAPTLPFNMPENNEPFLLSSLITGEKTIEVQIGESSSTGTETPATESSIGLEIPDMNTISKMMANPMMPKPKTPMTSIGAASPQPPSMQSEAPTMGLELPSGDEFKKMAGNMMMPKPSASLMKSLSEPVQQPINPPLQVPPAQIPPPLQVPPAQIPPPLQVPPAQIPPPLQVPPAQIPPPLQAPPTHIQQTIPPVQPNLSPSAFFSNTPTPQPNIQPVIPPPVNPQPQIPSVQSPQVPSTPVQSQSGLPKPESSDMIKELKLKIASLNKSLIDFEEKNIMGELSDEDFNKKKTSISTLISRIEKQINDLKQI